MILEASRSPILSQPAPPVRTTIGNFWRSLTRLAAAISSLEEISKAERTPGPESAESCPRHRYRDRVHPKAVQKIVCATRTSTTDAWILVHDLDYFDGDMDVRKRTGIE